MYTVLLWALGLGFVIASVVSWFQDRYWRKKYDALTMRAASYIIGLERLYKFPNAYVSDVADKALKGTLRD